MYNVMCNKALLIVIGLWFHNYLVFVSCAQSKIKDNLHRLSVIALFRIINQNKFVGKY